MQTTGERFPAVDFERFHTERLHELLASALPSTARAASASCAHHPLCLRTPSVAGYTYRCDDGSIEVTAGADADATVVSMSDEDWSNLIHELRSVPGLFFGECLTVERGDPGVLFRWEAPLRALFHGRPIYDADSALPRDAAGALLDLTRSFTLDDADPAISEFFDGAGFAVIRGVFDEAELATLRAAADEVSAAATPGDRRSWWARRPDGQQALCRVTYANETSQHIAALSADPRVKRLGALAGPGPVDAADRMDGHSVIIKHTQVTEGLADLPWHIDCGMGGHSVQCPIVQLSIFLEPGNRESGTLSVIPGSHRFVIPPPTPDVENDLPVVDIEASAGDCVVHLSDTMHAAKHPTAEGPGRRSIVISFFQPALLDIVGPGEAYNDVLLSADDGHVGGPEGLPG